MSNLGRYKLTVEFDLGWHTPDTLQADVKELNAYLNLHHRYQPLPLHRGSLVVVEREQLEQQYFFHGDKVRIRNSKVLGIIAQSTLDETGTYWYDVRTEDGLLSFRAAELELEQ